MSKDRRALAEAHPDTWIPVEDGERLEGKLVDVTQAWSDNLGMGGGFYPLLTIELPDRTTKKVHAFSTVIYQEVMSKQPEIGESVTFVYEGEGEAKNGRNAPKLYRLYIKGRTNMAQAVYGSIQQTQPGARYQQGGGAPAPVPAAAQQQAAAPTQDDDIPF